MCSLSYLRFAVPNRAAYRNKTVNQKINIITSTFTAKPVGEKYIYMFDNDHLSSKNLAKTSFRP